MTIKRPTKFFKNKNFSSTQTKNKHGVIYRRVKMADSQTLPSQIRKEIIAVFVVFDNLSLRKNFASLWNHLNCNSRC